MSSPTKPTVVFVHGAWHNASCWDLIREKLSKHSYSSVAVTLPSVGHKPAVKSHLEDTAVVRQELSRLIEQEGKEVILVMHSYGGVAGGGAVKGLERAARKEPGGVTKCIFLTAFLVPRGQSLLGMFDNQFPPYLEVDVRYAAPFLHCLPSVMTFDQFRFPRAAIEVINTG